MYRRAIEADGSVAAWHINLAVMLNDQKRNDEARVLLQVLSIHVHQHLISRLHGSCLHHGQQQTSKLSISPRHHCINFVLFAFPPLRFPCSALCNWRPRTASRTFFHLQFHVFIANSLNAPHRYNNFGSVLHGLGLLDEALREYNVALKLQV